MKFTILFALLFTLGVIVTIAALLVKRYKYRVLHGRKVFAGEVTAINIQGEGGAIIEIQLPEEQAAQEWEERSREYRWLNTVLIFCSLALIYSIFHIWRYYDACGH